MNRLIPQLFRSKQKVKRCVVVVGNDIDQLAQTFVEQAEKSKMHVYQVEHDPAPQNIQIEHLHSGLTKLRLNLINSAAVKDLIKQIHHAGHLIDLCVFQPDFTRLVESNPLSAQQIELQWQNTGLSAVSISQAMIRQMLRKGKGTLIFLGMQQNLAAENDLLSQSMFASIRALAQSLAREFHPKGIHIAYCMLPYWKSQNLEFMHAIQQVCWHVYQQPASTWTQELSLFQ